MLKKWGKFYARWTGSDGKRHIKACRTMRAARREQQKQRRETQRKKDRSPATSASSRAPGRRRPRTRTTKASSATSKRKPPWLNRPGEPNLVYIRLREEDAARALRRPSVAPARLGGRAWVEIPLASRADLEEAVRWFGIAYEHAPRIARKKAKR